MSQLDVFEALAKRTAEMAVREALRLIPERISVNQPSLMGVTEAAEYIAVSRRTMQTMIQKQEIATVREGKRLRVARSSLEEWIAKHTY